MYLQEILEVAIGLVFMWLVISIATMQVQEWLASYMGWRAKELERAIRGMLVDPVMAERFYDHPLIKSLARVSEKPGKRHLPSYIPADKFALALFDIVSTAGSEASVIQHHLYSLRTELDALAKDQQEAAHIALNGLIELARRAATTEAGTKLAEAALEELHRGIEQFAQDYPQLKPALDAAMAQIDRQTGDINALIAEVLPAGSKEDSFLALRRGALALAVLSPALKSNLETLLKSVENAEDRLAAARTSVETWFNDAMDRLSGWYKRNAQRVALIIGVVLALLMNVDSIALATHLWREPTVRQALIAQAETFTMPEVDPTAPEQAVREFRTYFNGLTLPLGWVFEPVPLNGQTCAFLPDSPNEVFGIWWGEECFRPANATAETSGLEWLGLKVAGILLSGAAAMQGAPFWFDILRKLINVRGTGANPAEKA